MGIPTQIKDYVLAEQLGGHSGKQFWKATHPARGTVFLKLVLPEAAGVVSGELRGVAIQRRARAAAALAGRGGRIPEVFDTGWESGTFWIAMEYVDVPSFDRHLARTGRICWKEAVEAAVDLLRVVDAMQKLSPRPLVHGDITRNNTLIRKTGWAVFLTDFGIAVELAQRGGRAANGRWTPAYCPPERIDSGGEVDEGADPFAIAVLTYEAMEGHLPYRLDEVTNRPKFQKPPSMPAAAPTRIGRVLLRALHPDPGQRLRDPEEFARELEAALPSAQPKPSNRWLSAGRLLLGSAMAIVFIQGALLLEAVATSEALQKDQMSTAEGREHLRTLERMALSHRVLRPAREALASKEQAQRLATEKKLPKGRQIRRQR